MEDASGLRVSSTFRSFDGRKLHHYIHSSSGAPKYSGFDLFVNRAKILHYDAAGMLVGESTVQLSTGSAGGLLTEAAAITAAVESVEYEEPRNSVSEFRTCASSRPAGQFGSVRTIALSDIAVSLNLGADQKLSRIDGAKFITDDTLVLYGENFALQMNGTQVQQFRHWANRRGRGVGGRVEQITDRYYSRIEYAGRDGVRLEFVRFSDWRSSSVTLPYSKALRQAVYNHAEDAYYIVQGQFLKKFDFESGRLLQTVTVPLLESQDPRKRPLYSVRGMLSTPGGDQLLLILAGYLGDTVISVWDASSLVELDQIASDGPSQAEIKAAFACGGQKLFIKFDSLVDPRISIIDLLSSTNQTKLPSWQTWSGWNMKGQYVIREDSAGIYRFKSTGPWQTLTYYDMKGKKSSTRSALGHGVFSIDVNQRGDQLLLQGRDRVSVMHVY